MTTPGSHEMLLDIALFRSDVREIIVTTIRSADPEVVYRPGAIPGGVGDRSIFAALVHIVDVEESWLREHLLGEGVQDGPDTTRLGDIEATAAVWAEVSAAWIAYLEASTDESLAVPYLTPGGSTVPVWSIAFHAFNHTTHHTSEMWTALTAAGIAPPELDFIAWARHRAPKA